jgi:ubiquinone/menaquinone biosynthesis C-methylase UbiE
MTSLTLDVATDTMQDTASAEKVAQAYSSPPWWYDVRGFFILTFAYQSTLWAQVGFFARNIKSRHLEVGIGTGTLLWMCLWFLRATRKSIGTIVGVDYAEQMLEGARRLFKRWSTVSLLHQDVAKMSPEALGFDSINVANSFHCFSEPEEALKMLHRALAPQGTLAMNVLLYPMGRGLMARIAMAINRWGIKKAILVRPYYANDVRARMEACGFELIEERFSGNCQFIVAKKRAAA